VVKIIGIKLTAKNLDSKTSKRCKSQMKNNEITFSNISPLVDNGKYYCKWETDLPFIISVTISGLNENSKVFLNFRRKAEKGWQQTIMESFEQNRFEAAIKTEQTGLYEYTFNVEIDECNITHDRIYEVYFDRPRARFAAWYEMCAVETNLPLSM